MSGSVIGAAAVAGMLSVTVAVTATGAGLVQRHALHVAADLAALAAADALYGFNEREPCEAASMIAARNSAELVECLVHDTAVVVSVTRVVLGASLHASARAGVEPAG